MKKVLLSLLVALFVCGTSRARAEVSLSYFYDSLADNGDWFEADDYGYCWQPRDVPEDWSPYSDGYWTYTDVGWTWVSYESFGWATYHYGRWANLRGRGWVWVPGYEWGPAWVSWRSNDDYVGWAPLPARAVVSVGVSIGRDVDYDYDIGPSYYHFTSCRRFGSPSLRQVIVDRSENVTIINQTTNITNISYRDDRVYNGGPDYERINRRSERPIERLRLDRVTRVDDRHDRRFERRENGRLTVVAPPVVPVEEKIRPRNIKARLGKVEADHGWSGVRDAKVAARTREKIREENKHRDRGPANRGGSVAQALRSEARQKAVASVPPQPATRKTERKPGEEAAARAAKNEEVRREEKPAEPKVAARPLVPDRSKSPAQNSSPAKTESKSREVTRETSNRRDQSEDDARAAQRRREQTLEREKLVREKARREDNEKNSGQAQRAAREQDHRLAGKNDAAQAEERRARQARQDALQERENREQRQARERSSAALEAEKRARIARQNQERTARDVSQRRAAYAPSQQRQRQQRPSAQQRQPQPASRPQVKTRERAPQPTPAPDSRKKKKREKDDDR